MKRSIFFAACLLVLSGGVRAADSGNAQEDQLLAAIKQIQTQQAQIAENQAKIEEKLASVGEAVRVARIYSSRSGR